MALSDIIFNKGEGGLGRPLPGQDYISGFAFYSDEKPSGFANAPYINKIFSLEQAEGLGINPITLPCKGRIRLLGTVAATDTLIASVGGNVIGSTTADDAFLANASLKLVQAINAATATNGGYTAGQYGTCIIITAPYYTEEAILFTTSGALTATYIPFFGADTVDATATLTVTVTGAAADTINVKIGGVSIGIATIPVAPTTTTVATAIALAITTAQYTNGGFTATSLNAVVTILAPTGTGTAGNSYTTTYVSSGATAATIGSWSGGVASNSFDVIHYHISEFFRVQPKGVLYVGIFDVPVAFDGLECTELQVYANGEIRQIGVYQTFEAFATTQIQALQSVYDDNYTLHRPFEILYGADIVGTALVDLPDLSLLDSDNVSLCIAQDGVGVGLELFTAFGVSITAIGAMLGTVSLSRVHEDIGWVGKFNLDDGTTLDTLAFANGDLYNSTADSLLTTLDDYHYNFLRKLVGTTGSFWNYGWTATISTSDYCTIENNRTIDKAIRNIRTNLLPSLNSPLYVNPDGTLTNATIGYFQGLAQNATDDMQRNGELSASKIIIDPLQDVLSTSELVLTVQLVPVGVAKQIVVNIGFTVNI